MTFIPKLKNSQHHACNARSADNYRLPKCRSSIGQHRAVQLFNDLLLGVENVKNLSLQRVLSDAGNPVFLGCACSFWLILVFAIF